MVTIATGQVAGNSKDGKVPRKQRFTFLPQSFTVLLTATYRHSSVYSRCLKKGENSWLQSGNMPDFFSIINSEKRCLILLAVPLFIYSHTFISTCKMSLSNTLFFISPACLCSCWLLTFVFGTLWASTRCMWSGWECSTERSPAWLSPSRWAVSHPVEFQTLVKWLNAVTVASLDEDLTPHCSVRTAAPSSARWTMPTITSCRSGTGRRRSNWLT